MQDNNRPRSMMDIITEEPDLLRRCALINFNMDMLESPEDALLSYKTPVGFYEKWAAAHFESLINRVALATGADPKQIADKEKRTPEQEQALIDAAAREQITRLEMVLKSNYNAAIKHINAYCIAQADAGGSDLYKPLREEQDPAVLQSGQLVNVPLAATLYFFATHEDINPQSSNGLTIQNERALITNFNNLDAFYREHRAEYHTEQELLKAFIASVTPNPEKAKETLEHIALKRAALAIYPIDKLNSTIWSLSERDTEKQVPIKAEKTGSKNEINIIYAIDFDALGDNVKITKRLLPYDKRVYIAIAALYDAGNRIITLTQIYYAMGYTGRPGSNDLQRINESITKMLGATIYIDNEQEKAASYNYEKFRYKGSLLPYEQVEVVANGQLVDAAIHLFREPPVITFAKQRNQITTIDIKLLQSPISKTDGNLLIDDYLIERISRAKLGKQPPKILYKTLYERAQITDKKQRQRATDKIKRFLDHHQKCGNITRYTMDEDGVTVYFTPQKNH